ncbi:MAG: relaxase/mobilization nuclease domain-containing protein [Sulfurovum sp.]|nr:relaxase/mobilization nuclease domain-containing protein [Sulfurovum sp.]MDD3602492.1 relaxase/mobilization nuclease domain-containing protein [Sulfurovum sp.]
MIVKQIAKKEPGKGSFSGLADYILDKANNGAKVDWYEHTNLPFEDIDTNIDFVEAVQKLNETAKGDKTLHFVFSFQEGEIPTKEVLRDIEKEFVRTLGLEEHQRISVVHSNTANMHAHCAISLIHPETYKLVDPYQSKNKLQKKAAELEIKHHLLPDNHTANWKLEKDSIKKPGEQQNPTIKDQEIHSGVKSFLSYIKMDGALDEIREILKNPSSTFEDLQKTLAEYNLEIKPRGNGIVIADKTRNLFVKASDVHRDLSKGKLTKKFGDLNQKITLKADITPKKKFGKPVNEYWKKYQELSQTKRTTKTEDLRLEKLARETLKTQITKKYAEKIKSVQLNQLMTKRDKAKVRKEIYSQRSKELKALQVTFAEKRKEIHSRTNQTSFKEYLMELALQGDEGALKELRKQKQEIKPDDTVLLHPEKKESHTIFKTMIDKITKQGNAVYKLGENSKLIDKGDHLKITADKSDEAMLKALKMAIAKYGNTLNVQGNLEFKKRVLLVSQKYDLKVNFTDPQMKKIQDQHQKQKQTQSKNQGMRR